MIQFHEFYGKQSTQQINSFLKGMSHLISVKDAAEYIRKHFNLKKVKLNSTGTRVMAFEQKDMSHCNCNAPKGFSCKAHCKAKGKVARTGGENKGKKIKSKKYGGSA